MYSLYNPMSFSLLIFSVIDIPEGNLMKTILIENYCEHPNTMEVRFEQLICYPHCEVENSIFILFCR